MVWSLAFLLLAVNSCRANSGQHTILVVGDSLSAGYGIADAPSWVMLLQDRLTEEGYGYQVVNASISGDTTGGGLRRLPRALENHTPDIVIIELGGNDGLRGTPVPTIRQNLAEMVQLSKTSGAKVLLTGILMPPNYGQRYTDNFSAMYPSLAEEYDTALVDFFMTNVVLQPGMMQDDQTHPTAQAQPVLLDNVWPVLKPLL